MDIPIWISGLMVCVKRKIKFCAVPWQGEDKVYLFLPLLAARNDHLL